MAKGRWLIAAILIVGLLTVGRKRVEELWYQVSRDPLVAVLVIALVTVMVWGIVRIVRS